MGRRLNTIKTWRADSKTRHDNEFLHVFCVWRINPSGDWIMGCQQCVYSCIGSLGTKVCVVRRELFGRLRWLI